MIIIATWFSQKSIMKKLRLDFEFLKYFTTSIECNHHSLSFKFLYLYISPGELLLLLFVIFLNPNDN